MPTLHWIGKDKVVKHHHDVPFRVLNHQYTFPNTQGDDSISENKIIHGDNLEALKALLPYYEGKIKCIYIDPPYNTGNEGWVYNDNVNDPKMKKWLGKVVGKEAEDLTRHDKWLCMMYPRLKLLHKLLAPDGAIFVSIDDNEVFHLKLMMDEIWGDNNSIGPIIQNKMNAKNDTINIQKNHEYILVYRKRNIISNGLKNSSTLINYDYSTKDIFEENEKFYFINDSITTRGEGGVLNARPNLGYTVYFHPETKDKIAICDYDIELAKVSNDITQIYSTDSNLITQGYYPIRPPKVRGKLGCWTWSLEKFNSQSNDIIITGKKDSYAVKKRTFVSKEGVFELNGKLFFNAFSESNSRSILDFSTNDGTNILNMIMNTPNTFDNPKNVGMLEYLIKLIPDKDSIILDSFAGSGTTAQAVLNLNKADGGNRKFILVEMEDYAETITAERVKRVINGYGNVEGTGGDFNYYELGESLFDEDHNLNENLPVATLRDYIWYVETKDSLPTETSEFHQQPYFLDKYQETAYFFIYEKEHITTLDYDFLEHVNIQAEQYVMYADNCTLSEAFRREKHIIFKKIPRDISRF